MYRITNGLVATATGASGAAIMAAVSQEGVKTWAMAAMSIGATAVAWYVARKTELKHMELMQKAEEKAAAREEARLDSQARRDERTEVLIQEITMARIKEGQGPATAESAARGVIASALARSDPPKAD